MDTGFTRCVRCGSIGPKDTFSGRKKNYCSNECKTLYKITPQQLSVLRAKLQQQWDQQKTAVSTPEKLKNNNLNNSTKSNMSKLIQDYEKILKSGDYSDVTLVIGGKKEFRVHKAILAARSPVFSVMFKHKKTCEARENRVDIIDVEVEVFEQLIRYIYTGKVEELDRFAFELMAAADKYQVNSLKDICEEYLCSNLTIETAVSVLLLADMHRAAKLRSNCIDYIAKNILEVKRTDGWKCLKAKHELLAELLLKLSHKSMN